MTIAFGPGPVNIPGFTKDPTAGDNNTENTSEIGTTSNSEFGGGETSTGMFASNGAKSSSPLTSDAEGSLLNTITSINTEKGFQSTRYLALIA